MSIKEKNEKSVFKECSNSDRISAEEYIDYFKIIEVKNEKIVKEDVYIFDYYLEKTLYSGDTLCDLSIHSHLYYK